MKTAMITFDNYSLSSSYLLISVLIFLGLGLGYEKTMKNYKAQALQEENNISSSLSTIIQSLKAFSNIGI